MKELGYGEEYKYSHDYTNNFAEQEFLPEALSKTPIYIPGNNSRENSIKEFLKTVGKINTGIKFHKKDLEKSRPFLWTIFGNRFLKP